MYALVALFNHDLEIQIEDIWNDLETANISYYAKEVKDRVPHITLASYSEIHVEALIKYIKENYNNMKSIPINFQSIGSFLHSNG
ncbi:MAG TPA: hypothetical protein VNR61_00085 [Niallia sp.]|nr:hypothetical protein [Niallia sp.]